MLNIGLRKGLGITYNAEFFSFSLQSFHFSFNTSNVLLKLQLHLIIMYQSLKRNNNLYREFSLPNFVCAQGFQNKKKKKIQYFT